MKKKIMAVLLAGVMVLAAGCSKEGSVTVGEYKGLALTNVSETEVDEKIASMLAESFIELQTVEREAKEGDTVNINFVGTKDGVAFEGGSNESEAGYDLKLGSKAFIEGFEEGLIGVVAGEERDLNLTFPENYGNADLAGQAVVFHVTVNEVKEEIIPELTDAFIVENFPDYKTVDEYKKACQESMNYESHVTQITELLMESSEVQKYNEADVKKEKETLIEQNAAMAAYYGSMYGLDADTSLQYFFGVESREAFEDAMGEYAYDVVKNSMIISEIAKMENIELTDEIYKEEAMEYAENYGYDDIESFENSYGKDIIQLTILSDMVMKFIIENAVISDAE